MRVGIPKEIRPGERRVAATPDTVKKLIELGFTVQIESGAILPEKGADIMAGGKSVGALGSSAGTGDSAVGLALLRLDKVAQAKDNGIPLQCGDAEILVKVPDWASFSLPEPSTAD